MYETGRALTYLLLITQRKCCYP